MPKKKHKPEEIVAKLRQADVLISQGQDIADVIRQIGVSEVTYYRLRYVDRLRRPRWRNGQLSTNIPPGPLDGGRSRMLEAQGPG